LDDELEDDELPVEDDELPVEDEVPVDKLLDLVEETEMLPLDVLEEVPDFEVEVTLDVDEIEEVSDNEDVEEEEEVERRAKAAIVADFDDRELVEVEVLL
jgi:hypothetical protein